MEVTPEFVRNAVAPSIWDLGNKVLYDLCASHPLHQTESEIAAKIWLIGRSYAAAIERRRGGHESENIGDDFYLNVVVPNVRNSGIDGWLSELKDEPLCSDLTLIVHKRVTLLFNNISGQDKRSLASKYLHFHLPGKFYMYDSRAAHAARCLAPRVSRYVPEADDEYVRFCAKAETLNCKYQDMVGRQLSTRELDQVLLAYVARFGMGPPPDRVIRTV